MSKAKKSIATVEQLLTQAKRRERVFEHPTPVALWSRALRKEWRAYARHWQENDARWCGGDEDRDYTRTRDIRRLSARRVYEREQGRQMQALAALAQER